MDVLVFHITFVFPLHNKGLFLFLFVELQSKRWKKTREKQTKMAKEKKRNK